MTKRLIEDLPVMLKNSKFKESYNALEQEFSIARALIEARTEANMTQSEVAGKMGVSQSSIARMESGRNVSIKSISRYAAAIGKPVFLEIHPS
jgi:DNA-binding XRE family transcriptional regulator